MGTDTDRSAIPMNFRSIVTMGLSRTVSEISGDFGRILNFFPLGAFNAHVERVSLEICNGGNAWKKLERMLPLTG